MNSIKKGISIAMKVLLWILIVVTAVFVFITLSAKQNDGVPKLFGVSPIVILSDSMKGTRADDFSKGDLVIIGAADTTKLKVNDIITFWDIIDGKKAMNTHRIIKIDKSAAIPLFYTKGDNNSVEDSGAKTPGDIVGIYKSQIKGAGNVMDFLGSKWGFLFCMVLPLFLFFVWRLVKLVMAVVDYRKAQIDDKTKETLEVKADE